MQQEIASTSLSPSLYSRHQMLHHVLSVPEMTATVSVWGLVSPDVVISLWGVSLMFKVAQT